MAGESLTPRRKRFCEEYVVDLNAAAAYQRAGYEAEGEAARTGASRLLTDANVQAEIARLQAERARRLQVRADDVLREYMTLAYRDFRQILTGGPDGSLRVKHISEWPESIGKAIEGIKIKQMLEKRPDGSYEPGEILEFKLASKTEALQALGRHLNLFADKCQHDIPSLDRLIELELARLAPTAGATAQPQDDSGPQGGGPAAVDSVAE